MQAGGVISSGRILIQPDNLEGLCVNLCNLYFFYFLFFKFTRLDVNQSDYADGRLLDRLVEAMGKGGRGQVCPRFFQTVNSVLS